ncbi:MAG: TetR family transcriptional regulator [Tardiphaga sp.]|nr:TetR family transcriptional regulator [Tardiphaga sp.]
MAPAAAPRITKSPRIAGSRGGRPTKTAALARDLRLLDAATELFLQRGFDATSIDAVAEAARVSKPTVYGQYKDKRGLFEAVLKREIGRWLAPLATTADIKYGTRSATSIENQLTDLGCQMIAFSNSSGAKAVTRILAAQATNFPELGESAYREGWSRAVSSVAVLFDQMVGNGLMQVDTTVAAECYLNIVVGPVSRLAIHGLPIDVAAEEKRMRIALKLLLNGLLSV